MIPTLQSFTHLLGRLCYPITFQFPQILYHIFHLLRDSLNLAPNAKAHNEHEATNRAFSDPKIPISYDTLKFLGSGKASVVYAMDEGRVLKEFHDDSGLSAVELLAYNRLGTHPNIAKLLGVGDNDSLILERGQVLRTICRAPANEVSIQKKLAWLKQAATGYQYAHSRDIIHGDVGTNNMIVTPDGCLKLIDFEGCSIDGKPADSCYEWFSYRRSVPGVTRQTDVFAFGCAMYEIETGLPPYHEFEKSTDPGLLVEQRYSDYDFPVIEHLFLFDLIRGCWQGEINTMGEVVRGLEALEY